MPCNLGGELKLTIMNRLKLCLEILTIKSSHIHTAQEKQLSTFQRGVTRVVSGPPMERWMEEFQETERLFSEAGVELVIMQP